MIHLPENTSSLLLNELISNSYEHAFKGRAEGRISILFKKIPEGYLLKVCDNGIGIPEGILENERSSLGITLIQSFSDQMNATLKVENKEGTHIEITIPE